MSDTFFTDTLQNAAVQQPEAADYAQNYPSLSQAESWRWTPLKALRSIARKPETAAYQFDFDDDVILSDAQGIDVLKHKDAPFAALNMAMNDDTLSIVIPKDSEITAPLALIIDAIGKKMQFSRLAVTVEQGAKASLWLEIEAERNAAQLPVFSVHVADNAEFDAVLWFNSRDDSATAQLAYMAVEMGEHSRCAVNAVQSGSALARLDVHAELHGQFSDFQFGGVQTAAGAEVADYHINVRHLTENCTSKQVARGVLNNEAQGIFDGMIYVAHGAQKTDAQQDSRFILLSKQAKSHSVPRLEIYADDVQCAHGSTVGFLDTDSLFYLQSRGIDKETAQTMLITSFLHEAVVVAQETIAANLHDAITQSWTGEDD